MNCTAVHSKHGFFVFTTRHCTSRVSLSTAIKIVWPMTIYFLQPRVESLPALESLCAEGSTQGCALLMGDRRGFEEDTIEGSSALVSGRSVRGGGEGRATFASYQEKG